MQSSSFPQGQEGLDLRTYLGMFLYHRWQVFCCIVVGLAFGIYQWSGYKPEYKATAVIKVEKKGPDLGPKASLTERVEQPFAEEMQIIKSRAFLERVAQRLNHKIELLQVTSPALQWLPWVSPVKAAPVTLRDVQVEQEARSGVYTLAFTD